jgi:hypothetical protein
MYNIPMYVTNIYSFHFIHYFMQCPFSVTNCDTCETWDPHGGYCEESENNILTLMPCIPVEITYVSKKRTVSIMRSNIKPNKQTSSDQSLSQASKYSASCFHDLFSYPDDGSGTFLRNSCKLISNHTGISGDSSSRYKIISHLYIVYRA